MNRFLNVKFLIIVTFLSVLTSCSQKLQSRNTDSKAELVVNCAVPDDMYPSDNMVIPKHSEFTKKHYPERIASFKENPLCKNDIVFVGNSITEQGGNWAQRLNNSKIKNRGISGDTTEGVLVRLGEIIYCEPTQIFILIGINDLFRDEMTSEIVASNIIKIVNQIHDKSPKTKIFVHTILPTNTIKIREKIQSTNNLLKKAAVKELYQIIELHNEFRDKEDLMNRQLSHDGVHLNDEGYKVWEKLIIDLIKKNNV
jgi:lysophospholipase L1-like esterase